MNISFHLERDEKITEIRAYQGSRCAWINIDIDRSKLVFFTKTIEDAKILEEAFKKVLK